MTRWLILVFIFAKNSFGATISTGGALELSYPYVLKIDVDKNIEPDSPFFHDNYIRGTGGIHVGVLGAGIHAGPLFYKYEMLSGKGIELELSCSYLWASLHSDLKKEIFNGISIGYFHSVGEHPVYIPIKIKFQMYKKFWLRNQTYFGGSIGVFF